MSLISYLEALEGPLKGTYILIENGTVLGRNQGDILLKDSKVSSSHAKIETDASGRHSLLDLNSGNGIYVGERRVKKVSLMRGVVFNIGKSSFKVHEGVKQDIEFLKIIQPWRSRLTELLKKANLQDTYILGQGLPFIPALKIDFIQGIQMNHSAIFYYGPRLAGQSSLDLELLDPHAPEQAFTLIPQGRSAKIWVNDPKVVLINNHSLKEHLLIENDIIGFGGSLIRVSYV